MKPIEIANKYHENAIQGLRDMVREYAQQAKEGTYPFQVTIMAFDGDAGGDIPTQVSIDNIVVEDDAVIVCYDGAFEDIIGLFSYNETYEILCELCKRL